MTDSKKSDYNFDQLRMYFGDDYIIECENHNNIVVHQPTIGDIVSFGEAQFYKMLYVFVGNPTMYRLELWDMGIDWNKISDYDLFRILISTLHPSDTYLLFGNLDLSSFQMYTKQIGDEKTLTLYNEELDIEISEETYSCISSYLRKLFNIYPKVEKAKGKTTKQWMIDEEREKRNQREKGGSESSTLLPLISSCVNHPGFKFKTNELRDIGIYQFMDSVKRLQVYESSRALNNGVYSGMCDLSKVPKELFDFTRPLD